MSFNKTVTLFLSSCFYLSVWQRIHNFIESCIFIDA